jgi:diguanylate cyclase (GGDEF)-like protein
MLTDLYRTVQRRCAIPLLVALCFGTGSVHGRDKSLHERLIDIEEVTRITPQRALPQLERLRPLAIRGTPADQAEFLVASSLIQHGLGKHAIAVDLCDEAIILAKSNNDNDVIAQALLSKAYSLFSLNDTAGAHKAAWQAEQIAADSNDQRLRVRALISSGDSFAEAGNFVVALDRLQSAAGIARQSKDPLLVVIALRSLALLYDRMREFDKGFVSLDEAMRAARQVNAEGRLSLLMSTEYALSIDSGQTVRALSAQLSALALQRKLDAAPMVGVSLVNLADCYLKLSDPDKALSYAEQALDHADALNDASLAAAARMNIGQAQLAMGRIAAGKESMRVGLAWYEKSGRKPELQAALGEYADALQSVGELVGATNAYRRERALLRELFDEHRQKATLELHEKYETDKVQREIASLRQVNQINNAELDNRKLQQRIWWLLALLLALVSGIVYSLYRKMRQTNVRLCEKNLELRQQSVRDPLTTLYNRRHFQEFMRRHSETAQRAASDETVSAMFLIDVDHFKEINDTYGHGAGDAVLREIAVALREILRETDMIVRWGGEEFLAFLPSVPRAGLDEVARRLLNGISARKVIYQDECLSVEASIGFAPFPLSPGAESVSWERAVDIVDMALYLAKGHGRNRAYGVRSFPVRGESSVSAIEQDIEKAWREGQVELSIVLGAGAN